MEIGTDIYASKIFCYYNATDQTFGLIHLFVMLFRCVYCFLKNQ